MWNPIRRSPPIRRLLPLAALMALTATVSAADPPDSPADVNTREVSIYVMPPVGPLAANDVVTREVSLYVSGPSGPLSPNDVVTREVSLYVSTGGPAFPDDVITREVSLYTSPAGGVLPPDNIVTREVSTFLTPYTMAEALTALKIAGGRLALSPSDSAEFIRLNVVPSDGLKERIDLADAVKLARLASGLEPYQLAIQ